MFKISLFYFLASLFFGVLVVYIIHPKPQVITKYPSIDALDTIYRDDKNKCYKYIQEDINC